jgi:gamma-D-glutamyl-L-lysine dipeptidyl-peptidase
MLETAQSIIETLANERQDFRVELFEVHPFFEVEAASQNGCLSLRGRVLEQSDLHALLDGLAASLPGACFDTSRLEVLRKPGNPLLSVSTNLTSLHREPSFLAEQLSQLVNGMQVEVLVDADPDSGRSTWCYVRQTDGYLGWTYRPYLSADPCPPPTHFLVSPLEKMLAKPEFEAEVVTRVLGGTALHVLKAHEEWCEAVLAGGKQGWLPLTALRGLSHLPSAPAQRRAQIVKDGLRMTGTPYLWGGNSANGIDCSGLAQLLHRWVGLSIPRDADMQCAAGKPVEPPFQPGDLLFFGEKGEKRRVTHVGVSLGGWNILHSSRSQNGVYRDDVQAVPHLKDSFLAAATFLEE